MQIVTSTEFQKNFGQFSAMALREPIILSNNGRQTHVLMSIDDCIIPENEELPYQFNGKASPEFKTLMQERFQKHAKTITKLSNC